MLKRFVEKKKKRWCESRRFEILQVVFLLYMWKCVMFLCHFLVGFNWRIFSCCLVCGETREKRCKASLFVFPRVVCKSAQIQWSVTAPLYLVLCGYCVWAALSSAVYPQTRVNASGNTRLALPTQPYSSGDDPLIISRSSMMEMIMWSWLVLADLDIWHACFTFEWTYSVLQ